MPSDSVIFGLGVSEQGRLRSEFRRWFMCEFEIVGVHVIQVFLARAASDDVATTLEDDFGLSEADVAFERVRQVRDGDQSLAAHTREDHTYHIVHDAEAD